MSALSGLSFSGLATGMDTQSLVQGLLSLDKARVSILQTRQKNVSLLRDTFDSLKTQVADLQSRAQRLGKALAGAFDGRKATSSEPSLVTAAAGSTAIPGTHSFVVKSLAQAHQVASVGLADANALLKTGTFTLKVGTGATKTITVTDANNTLQGVAAAINASGGDVTASVINDGQANPHRLVLSSKKTGLANQIVADTSGLTGGSGAALSLTQTIQSGTDAEVLLGSGAQAISVKSATNKLESLVAGVTINLLAADQNKTVTLTVANDTEAAKTAVQDFVTTYNKVVDFIGARTGYDTKTKQAGSLLGNGDAYAVQSTLARTMGSVVAGVSSKANRLSAFGVTFDTKGKLNIDSAKLDQALAGQIEGVTLDDVRRAFALAGTSTHAGVSFVNGGNKTLATTSPIGVKITAAATQAVLTGGAVQGLTIDGTNDKLDLTINGKSATISLTQQAYADVASLAQEVQGLIDGNATFGAGQVTVRAEGGALKFTTVGYGATAGVTVTGGNGATNLGFTAGQTAAGTDVVGKFLVGAVEEAATGKGQTLTGNTGNATTEGLQLKVALTQAQLIADPNTPEAQVSVTVGLGAQLDRALAPSLAATTGRFQTIHDSYTRSFDDIQEAIDRQNARITAKQASLVLRFSAMEAAVSRLQSLGAQLGTQFAGLSNLEAS